MVPWSRLHPALQCRSLSKSYPGAGAVPALGGVDLSINDGEWVAIMGQSGSGKSTLLNLVAGLDVPDSGQVLIAGESMGDASATRRAHLRRTHIGIVLQSLNLLADLTARQNIELPMRMAGVRKSVARERANDLLDDMGLGDLGDRLPSRMSGGQQQRIAIARALVNQPALVLADEPTGSLDRASATAVLDVLRRSHRNGQTLVVVTHDQRVASYADRVVTLEDGLVVTG